MNLPSPSLLTALQKLPIFQDVSPTQLKQLFTICQQESYEEDVALCRIGTESDRMYILLSGSVKILTRNRALIAREKAITTVGETGLLVGEPRAASVVTETPVIALVINKRPLQLLMREDSSLAIRFYRNVMAELRQKLILADQRIEELSEGREEGLEETSSAES